MLQLGLRNHDCNVITVNIITLTVTSIIIAIIVTIIIIMLTSNNKMSNKEGSRQLGQSVHVTHVSVTMTTQNLLMHFHDILKINR